MKTQNLSPLLLFNVGTLSGSYMLVCISMALVHYTLALIALLVPSAVVIPAEYGLSAIAIATHVRADWHAFFEQPPNLVEELVGKDDDFGWNAPALRGAAWRLKLELQYYRALIAWCK